MTKRPDPDPGDRFVWHPGDITLIKKGSGSTPPAADKRKKRSGNRPKTRDEMRREMESGG